MPRKILEEKFRLLLVNVKAGGTHLARFDPLQQRLGINQRTAGGVDDDNALFHAIDRGAVDHMVGFTCEGAVQGNDVAFRKKLVQ